MTVKMFVLVFAALYSVNGHGGIYKCTDAKKHVIYTDTACSTKAGRLAVKVSPIEEAPHSSFFSAPIEKIKGFIKSFSNGSTTSSELPTNVSSAKQQEYQCDGRTYCSQMSSCAEATFFINNCPDTKMDGDNDGIPCESQWCQ
jgi:hypothetical protein